MCLSVGSTEDKFSTPKIYVHKKILSQDPCHMLKLEDEWYKSSRTMDYFHISDNFLPKEAGAHFVLMKTSS